MSKAFKRLEVCDVFYPEHIATFTRPLESSDVVAVCFNDVGDVFHLNTQTLKVVADTLLNPTLNDVSIPSHSPRKS